MTLLASTSQRSSIDDVIELEVGRDCFLIRIKELGFNIHSAFKLKDGNKNPGNRNSGLKIRESSSESSSENVRVSGPAGMDINKSLVEDEAINVMCLGNSLKEANYDSRHVGEAEISGCGKSSNQDELEINKELVHEVRIDVGENDTENSIHKEGNAFTKWLQMVRE
ncbi:hypothetical protein V6N13_080530 [Hibiscus sabdariffa]